MNSSHRLWQKSTKICLYFVCVSLEHLSPVITVLDECLPTYNGCNKYPKQMSLNDVVKIKEGLRKVNTALACEC